MDAGRLNQKLEVWAMVKLPNELNEMDYVPRMLKAVHAEIIPQTGSLQRQQGIETVLSQVTHKVIVRYLSGKFITPDMWMLYRGQRFNIRFILDPFMRHEKLELFCEEVIG
ncbi:phage head closure protein [Paenibacillus sp. MWE-103]|uniref:Phage head closure protein n=1 Tax=Paenibacillus artemisiicola TaxID=1172618 RepID=A0ABS3WGE1_9BACL|nr:phage head closure protein [Paenibacillus artemisiicola]MBO7747357.1 phage head closure protein [Paenibacillus artemisiicola]